MKKFISLILSILILCSVFVGVGAISYEDYEPVEVTLTSQQGVFEDVTKTYAKGEVFEMTVFWQDANLLRNLQLHTMLNSNGLRVISEEINSEKLSGSILSNITETLQTSKNQVIFTFTVASGCDFTTAGCVVTYQIQVLDTASAEETLTLNCREAVGAMKDDLGPDLFYISKSVVSDEYKDSFSLSAELSEPEEVPTEPTTEPSTNPSSETESSSQTESSSETEPTSETQESSNTEATDPSETANNTENSTPTEPSSSDNTEPTTPSETTEPSESTEPTEEHIHTWDKGIILTPPSCTENGEAKYVCTECGAFTFEIIEAGHKEIIVNAKDATYFAKGYTGDTVCENCDEVLAKGKNIKKLKLKKPTVSYKSGKKKFTVKYTKVKGAKGFEVKYKLGKKSYTKTFKAKKSCSKVVKNLKKGKYKVKVRAYTKKGKTFSYGKWSKKTTVKVK